MLFKKCSVCNEEKEIEEFYSQTRKSGHVYYHPECKKCTSNRSCTWIKANPDRKRKHGHDHNIKHNKKILIMKKATEKKRREEGKTQEWQRNNPEKMREYGEKRYSNKLHTIKPKEWEACKLYFDYKCAYCGMSWEEHIQIFKKDLNREHVDYDGANDLSNCVPACTPCNSSKRTKLFVEWYSENNLTFTRQRYDKILMWLDVDYKKYIIEKPNAN